MIRAFMEVASRTLAAGAVLWACASGFGQETQPSSVKDRFEAMDARGDRAGVMALWKAHPDQALLVIDSYLEGSLSLREKSETPDEAQIRALQARAARGAAAADEALGRKIFSDYVAAFVGWNASERKRFREGQQAYGEARAALKASEYQQALDHARRCTDLARPLGDWWGAAMGWSGIGAAHEKLGNLEEAVAAHAAARLIYHDLALVGAEYRSLRGQCRVLLALGRLPHAINSLRDALVLAEQLQDAAGREELEASLAAATAQLTAEETRDRGNDKSAESKPAGGR